MPYEAPSYTGPEPGAEVANGRICKRWMDALPSPLPPAPRAMHPLTGRPRHRPKDHGSCHCGAVTLAIKIKPLETWDASIDEERMVDCNCSICVRVSRPVGSQGLPIRHRCAQD